MGSSTIAAIAAFRKRKKWFRVTWPKSGRAMPQKNKRDGVCNKCGSDCEFVRYYTDCRYHKVVSVLQMLQPMQLLICINVI